MPCLTLRSGTLDGSWGPAEGTGDSCPLRWNIRECCQIRVAMKERYRLTSRAALSLGVGIVSVGRGILWQAPRGLGGRLTGYRPHDGDSVDCDGWWCCCQYCRHCAPWRGLDWLPCSGGFWDSMSSSRANQVGV